MRWCTLFLAVSAIGACACGGKVAPGTSIANVDACAASNVCTLISPAQVSTAMGETYVAGAPEIQTSGPTPVCSFTSPMSAATSGAVFVSFDCPHHATSDLRSQFAQQASLGYVSVSGVGDEAIWSDEANELVVISGQNAFGIAIEFSDERTDHTESQATAIAQDLIANL